MHRRRVSGRVVQLIAGHLSFGAIASLGALSLVDSVNKFAAKHWMSCGTRVSLKCELRAYAVIPPLFKGDWTNCWSSEVYCSLRRAHGTGLCHGGVLVFAVRPAVNAFQPLELADPAPGDEFPEKEYEERSLILPKLVPSCFPQTLWRLVVLCGMRTVCFSKRGPRFEQCTLFAKDFGMFVYFSCLTIWHWFCC